MASRCISRQAQTLLGRELHRAKKKIKRMGSNAKKRKRDNNMHSVRNIFPGHLFIFLTSGATKYDESIDLLDGPCHLEENAYLPPCTKRSSVRKYHQLLNFQFEATDGKSTCYDRPGSGLHTYRETAAYPYGTKVSASIPLSRVWEWPLSFSLTTLAPTSAESRETDVFEDESRGKEKEKRVFSWLYKHNDSL